MVENVGSFVVGAIGICDKCLCYYNLSHNNKIPKAAGDSFFYREHQVGKREQRNMEITIGKERTIFTIGVFQWQMQM